MMGTKHKSNILRDNKYEEIYQVLGNSEDRIFNNMRDLMLFSASLAINKELEPIALGDGREAIKIETFSNYFNIIDIVALVHTKDIFILLDENYKEKLEIFESYVNAGMKYLSNEVINDDYKGLIKQIIEENREPIINKEEVSDLLDLKYN